jgi:cobalt/nickel transport system permease protein
MLLIRAFDRSERILCAMKCRGFRGDFPNMGELKFMPAREYAFAGMMLAAGALLVAVEMLRVATF